jgi:hypothetical protein
LSHARCHGHRHGAVLVSLLCSPCPFFSLLSCLQRCLVSLSGMVHQNGEICVLGPYDQEVHPADMMYFGLILTLSASDTRRVQKIECTHGPDLPRCGWTSRTWRRLDRSIFTHELLLKMLCRQPDMVLAAQFAVIAYCALRIVVVEILPVYMHLQAKLSRSCNNKLDVCPRHSATRGHLAQLNTG